MHFSVICALAASSLTLGQKPVTLYGDTNCGQANSPSDHIYRGVEAVPHEFPWQVLIILPDHLDGSRFERFCGGTLLERNLVVTAAHCFGKQAKFVRVILGEKKMHGSTCCVVLDLALALLLLLNYQYHNQQHTTRNIFKTLLTACE